MIMNSRHQTSGRQTKGTRDDNQHASIDELIRKLVSNVVRGRNAVNPTNLEFCGEQILVDASVEGVRYLLVRMPADNSALCTLSPREREISHMVAMGNSNKVIAGVLNISLWTVFARTSGASLPSSASRHAQPWLLD